MLENYNQTFILFTTEMTKGNQTVREWLEERRKSVEDLSLQIIEQNQARIDELEEENKKLKHEVEQFKKGVKAGTKIIERLEEENKKLKEEKEKSDSIINKKIIDLHNQVVELLEENNKLKEYNSNLMKEVKLCYKKLEK